jgi:Ser/Thr protein kinase RdoA (MazF antagonist)
MVEGARGQSQPLALLDYIPGKRFYSTEPNAAALYRYLLGRTHSILLAEPDDWCAFDLYDFLLEEDPAVATQPGLALLIRQAIKSAHAYEARRTVTFGVIWADTMEIRLDNDTRRIGIIDWGAIARGPLLFDIALNVLWHFPEGSHAHREFIHAYLNEVPISADELAGIKYYKALLWARQAKFYAYCMAENVTLGGSTPTSNAENRAKSRQELERSLENL